jgi:hypothetical protein
LSHALDLRHRHFHRRVLVRLLGLLAAAINLLRVAGHSSVFGFMNFG